MLKLSNIDMSFNSGTIDETVLFDKFNFKVKKDDFVSIVGSNGSGKTTLLNIICGSMPIDDGRIMFCDNDITKLTESKRAKNIGRVFQDPKAGTAASLSILENMALADNKGKKFGLAFAVNKKKIEYYKTLLKTCEMGLENRLNTKVASLSGGQRQALALVIANMTPIDLLILDEHTAALDPKSSETIMKLTDKIVKEKGVTTIMVTHNLRYALEYGNRLVMMDEGKAIIDICDEEKKDKKIDDLLNVFNKISIEKGN